MKRSEIRDLPTPADKARIALCSIRATPIEPSDLGIGNAAADTCFKSITNLPLNGQDLH